MLFIYKSKRQSSSNIAFDIIGVVPKINLRDKEEIEKVLDNYWIYKRIRIEEKSNILYRFTAPFYFVWVLLLITVICPVKWVITGKYTMQYRGKLAEFTYNWYTRLSNE